MSAQRDCIHGHLARSCELCAAQNDHATACEQIERLRAELAARDAKIEKLTAWISDLQSGMYVNCVYCGHRYGPGETTPVSMSDALKAHIAQCPEHPMSALRAKLAALRAEKVSQCGHPSSLMLRSAETGKALYCELCDERKRRRDAESMEEHYKARAEKAEAEAARLRADMVWLYSQISETVLYQEFYPHYTIGSGLDGLRSAIQAARAGGGE